MSKEELHNFAISEIEDRMQQAQDEPQGGYNYYLRGIVWGMIEAYFQAGVLSMEEYNNHRRAFEGADH